MKQFNRSRHMADTLLFSAPCGQDPLIRDLRLSTEREEKFNEQYPDFAPFFHSVVNGDNTLFRSGLLYFFQLSMHFYGEMHRNNI